MKKITLAITSELMGQMGLTDGADELAVAGAINTLAAKAKKYDTVQAQLTQLTSDNEALEAKMTEMRATKDKEAVKALIAAALDAKKITVAMGAQLERDYAGNPVALKTLIEGMPAYTSLTETLKKMTDAEAKQYEGKTWDELMAADLLEGLKANNPELYKQVYEKQFGKAL